MFDFLVTDNRDLDPDPGSGHHRIKEFVNLIAESQVDWLAIPGSHVSSLFPVLLLLLVSPLKKKKNEDRNGQNKQRYRQLLNLAYIIL
jgi:hypothetical protein